MIIAVFPYRLFITSTELGLSHIINAEGEKLQYVLGTLANTEGLETPPTVDDLIKINESICDTLGAAAENNLALNEKMKAVLSTSQFSGATGPTGPTGPPGPATIKIDSVDALDPGLLPTVENVGPDDQHVELKFGIPRGVTGDTGATGATGKSAYEIALEKGFVGSEEEWLASLKASSVTIVPFASQQAPYVGANATGEPVSAAPLGFGYLGFSTGLGGEDAHVAVAIDPNDGSFNLGVDANKNRQVAFSMPFDMKLNSIYLTTGNWEVFSGLIPRGTEVFPYVQVYTATAGTNTFLPIEGAFAKPLEGLHPESAQASTMLKAETTGLAIDLKAGTRIAICGMVEITGDTAARSYYLYFTGGIGLSF